MPRMKRMIEGPDGWCEWQQPVMKSYRMACCDCGLVHDVDFKVLRKGKDLPNGEWVATPLDAEKYRVSMRARRNNRSTSAMRRKKK